MLWPLQEGRLGENMKVHKSQLEKDRERALALQAARKTAGHNPLTPFPARVCMLLSPLCCPLHRLHWRHDRCPHKGL